MREILFRGKRIGDGKWFEGYYCGGTENKTIRKPQERKETKKNEAALL